MSVCRNIAAEVAAGRLESVDIDDLMAQLEAEKAALGKLDSVESRLLERGRVIASEAVAEVLIQKRARLQNIVVEGRLMEMMRRADAAVDNPAMGLQAKMVGVNAPIEGALHSVDAVATGMWSAWKGGLLHDMRVAGVWAAFRKMSGELELDVARALEDLSRKVPTTVRGSKTARAIAGVMYKYREAAKSRVNRAGGMVRDLDGYIARTEHDPRALRVKGEDAWKAAALQRFDFDRMEIAPERIEGYLESAYTALESGVRLTDEVAPVERAFKGPGNLAEKLSAAREIHFKSAEDWVAYNREFGSGSLVDSFMTGLERSARAAALMDAFGTNPKAMLERMKQIGAREWRSDARKLAAFRGGLENLDHQMAELDGSVNFGSGSRVAEIGANIRAVQTFAKLGRAILSVPSDLANVMATRSYQGRTILEALADSLTAPFSGLEGGAAREFADLSGAGIDGLLGSISARVNPTEYVSGARAKALNIFFKMNFLTQWTDGVKRGMHHILARDLAVRAELPFERLSDESKRLLSVYGIDARKWEVARGAVRELPDGRKYLMPGDVEDVRGAVFDGLSAADERRLRDDVRESLFALMTHESDFAVPVPGARERAMLRRGYRPDSVPGQALRFMAQFKGFPTTVITKTLGRQLYGFGAKTMVEQLSRGVGANATLAAFIAMSSVLGLVSLQAKQVTDGKSPRPMSVETILAAMAQGGALGIYGDFLFGQTNRFGGGVLETTLGPGIGTAGQFFDLLLSVRGIATGEDTNVAGDTVHLLKQNLPFANLLYAKGAMDYLIWYQLQEMMNPGYLARMEARVKKDQGQSYFIAPSEIVERGGGFR